MLRLEHVCVRWSLSVCVFVCVCERDGVFVCVGGRVRARVCVAGSSVADVI